VSDFLNPLELGFWTGGRNASRGGTVAGDELLVPSCVLRIAFDFFLLPGLPFSSRLTVLICKASGRLKIGTEASSAGEAFMGFVELDEETFTEQFASSQQVRRDALVILERIIFRLPTPRAKLNQNWLDMA